METCHGILVETARLNVGSDVLLHTPVEIRFPIGITKKHEFEIRITLADILQTLFHGRIDYGRFAKPVFNHLVHHSRQIAAVVGVDSGSPFQFDERINVIVLADLQIFLQRTDFSGIGFPAAGLRVSFRLEFIDCRFRNVKISTQAVGRIVMNEDKRSVASHFHIRFQIKVSHFRTGNKRLARIFHTPEASTVSDQRRCCPRRQYGSQCQEHCNQFRFHRS